MSSWSNEQFNDKQFTLSTNWFVVDSQKISSNLHSYNNWVSIFGTKFFPEAIEWIAYYVVECTPKVVMQKFHSSQMNFLFVVLNETLHWAFQWSFKVFHLKWSLLWKKNENYTMKHSAIITNIGGIKKERSALVTLYWDSQFRDKLWLLPLSGTEHNQQRIIKIPVVKNPQKCWMQKVFLFLYSVCKRYRH